MVLRRDRERWYLYWYPNCVAASIDTDRQIHCEKGAVLMVNPNACKHQPAEVKPSSSHPSEGSFPALLHPTVRPILRAVLTCR